MSFPKLPANYAQERLGVTAVAEALARLGLIWRETGTGDVGIDGQIEYVDSNGYVTGQLIAAQVKSGISFFADGDECWRFYPDEKHRFYWERFPLPVILFLHHPNNGLIYWVDARQELRTLKWKEQAFIGTPKSQILGEKSREALFQGTGEGVRNFV